jgi:quercetin dioxygenase-like cupin family protein
MATAVARDEGSIPVAASTIRHESIVAGDFRVSDVTFAPGKRLPRHRHPHGCIAVVVEGAVDKAFARVSGTAAQGAVITMPAEEPHVDAFGRAGARIVVVESQAEEDVTLDRDWACLLIATKIARELEAPDSFTPLAVEGLALELAAAARRLAAPGAPHWLQSARELALERALEPVSRRDRRRARRRPAPAGSRLPRALRRVDRRVRQERPARLGRGAVGADRRAAGDACP